MGTLPLLDTFIGLIFVYLLLALVCTTLMEWIAQLKNLRGKMLVEGTRQLLGEEDDARPLTDAYLDHPLIRTLRDGNRMPSYVPSPIFAKSLKAVLSKVDISGNKASHSPELITALETLKESDSEVVKGESLSILPSDQSIAEWYDQAMERVSGRYKRKTRSIILFLAFGVTIALNVNTLTLTSRLYSSPTLRALLIERAKVRLDQGEPLETVEYTDPTTSVPTEPIADSSKSPNRLLDEEGALLGQMFGWSDERARIDRLSTAWGGFGPIVWLLISLLGWTITALAVSLGAPFWFDTLNRFMQLRSSGPPPVSTQRKPGETKG